MFDGHRPVIVLCHPRNGLTLKENIMIDYEKLYREAVYHLRVVAGSRNSFEPEVHQILYADGIGLKRSQYVEKLHREANAFLKEHDL